MPEINSPLKRSCFALPSPIFFIKKIETIAGINPILTSVYPNFEFSPATIKSQTEANPQPPAIAGPFTAAIIGLGNL